MKDKIKKSYDYGKILHWVFRNSFNKYYLYGVAVVNPYIIYCLIADFATVTITDPKFDRVIEELNLFSFFLIFFSLFDISNDFIGFDSTTNLSDIEFLYTTALRP